MTQKSHCFPSKRTHRPAKPIKKRGIYTISVLKSASLPLLSSLYLCPHFRGRGLMSGGGFRLNRRASASLAGDGLTWSRKEGKEETIAASHAPGHPVIKTLAQTSQYQLLNGPRASTATSDLPPNISIPCSFPLLSSSTLFWDNKQMTTAVGQFAGARRYGCEI